MKKIYIYELFCPITNLPKYIGKSVTSYDLNNNKIKTYDYIEQAVLDGFSASCISKCIIGRNKTHKGLIFKLT